MELLFTTFALFCPAITVCGPRRSKLGKPSGAYVRANVTLRVTRGKGVIGSEVADGIPDRHRIDVLAVAAADHGAPFGEWRSPGEAQARVEIEIAVLNPGLRKSALLWGFELDSEVGEVGDDRLRCVPVIDVIGRRLGKHEGVILQVESDVINTLVGVRGRMRFPAQSGVDGEVLVHAPVVLDVRVDLLLAGVPEGRVLFLGVGIRGAEEEIRIRRSRYWAWRHNWPRWSGRNPRWRDSRTRWCPATGRTDSRTVRAGIGRRMPIDACP